MFEAILLLQMVSTLYMVGLIWFVQLVHYPLFAAVGREEFLDYESRHTERTGWAVVPAMLAELGSALWLALTPGPLPDALALSGLLLLVGIWAVTFTIQVPCHRRLSEDGFDPSVHRRLVDSNWLRTGGWSLRGALIVAMVALLIG